MSHSSSDGDGVVGPDRSADEQRLAFVREETRFELQLLHERVNALLSAEAFLTIAYTAAMSNGAVWGHVFAVMAAPALAILGLLLALLAWPGVAATARIVLTHTAVQEDLIGRLPRTPTAGFYSAPKRRSAVSDQRRSLLFSRTVPALFTVVWTVLLILTLSILL